MPIEKRKEVVYSRFAKSLFTPDGLKNFKKSGLITADMFGRIPRSIRCLQRRSSTYLSMSPRC
jgi:hypothetical protein